MTKERIFFILAILISVVSATTIVVYARDVANTVCPTETCLPDEVIIGNASSDLIVLEKPAKNSIVSNPIKISGKARGYWFFEGTFPIMIVNWDGLIIGEGYATAQDEWMTEDFVPFKAEVAFTMPDYSPRGAIILQKDNPSGLPQYDNALEVPILFW